MVVPKGYSQGVLQLAHEHSQSDHLEVKKTWPHPPSLAECWEQFFWLGLKTDVAKPVACQIAGKCDHFVQPVPIILQLVSL